MYPLGMMFSNPRLQRTFSQVVTDDNEIGGWLMCRAEPYTWPGKYSWSAIKRALGDISPMFYVESFIIVPNDDENPATNWRAWDFQKAREMVKVTAKANGYHPVHFHTHPTGNPEPSRNDIAFAATNCQLWNTAAEFVIATARPLRLWPYRFEWGQAAAPDRGTWADGQFFSWYEKRVRELRVAA